jgi:SAM-dependent methyltransferase
LQRWVKRLVDTKAQSIPDLQSGKMLEIGCASGSDLHKMAILGWRQAEGIGFSPQAAESARQSGLRVHTGSLETVLEHLHESLKRLQKRYTWTNPGVCLALTVSNAASLEFQLFKSRWFALQLPNHLYHFTPDTIRKLLTEAGWEFQAIHHQQVLSSLFASTGYLLEDKGWHRLMRWLVGRPSDKVRLYQILYPLANIAARLSQTGRRTVLGQETRKTVCSV